MMIARDLALLRRVLDFLDDEAENRSDAGSSMSDYEREPRELAEELTAMLDSWYYHSPRTHTPAEHDQSIDAGGSAPCMRQET